MPLMHARTGNGGAGRSSKLVSLLSRVSDASPLRTYSSRNRAQSRHHAAATGRIERAYNLNAVVRFVLNNANSIPGAISAPLRGAVGSSTPSMLTMSSHAGTQYTCSTDRDGLAFCAKTSAITPGGEAISSGIARSVPASNPCGKRSH